MVGIKICDPIDKICSGYTSFNTKDELSSEIRSFLLQEMKFLKNYGVDHLGYRYFLSDGRSFGCPTVTQWYMQKRSRGFYEKMKPFLTKELINFAENNSPYVTRSKSHTSNKYLDYLRTLNLGSSVGIYKTAFKRIDSFFFISNLDLGESRDVLINNIHILEKYANKLSMKINEILPKILSFQEVDIHIDQDICKKIFDCTRLTNANEMTIISDGCLINLTSREIEVLKSINLGVSNKILAQILSISEKTTEKHIANIKTKFNVNCKNDLVRLSEKVQFKILM